MNDYGLSTKYRSLLDAVAGDDLALFVGAGFSKLAGFPLWTQLLEPLLDTMAGLPKDLHPVDGAQYYVNAHAQGRHLLIKHLQKELSIDRMKYAAPLKYIKEL